MTLGGNLPSAFAPASGSLDYVGKAGDTMTGTLNLPSNGLVAGTNQFILSGGNVGIGTASPSAPLHVRKGGSNLTSIGDSNMVALFENGVGGSTNVWLNSKPASAGATDDNYYFEVNGAGVGGLRYNVGGDYVALTADTTPSSLNNEPFVLKGRNVGVGTVTPTAKLDVNGTANFSGLVTFAPGQTFPGAGNGTITSVTAGSGLSSGGSSGNVTLNNTGVLSVTATNGIASTGGQNPALSLNTTFTDAHYAQLSTSNNFVGNQTVTGTVTGNGNSGTGVVGSGSTGVAGASLSAGGNGVYGQGGPGGTGVFGTSYIGVFGQGGSYGVVGQGGTGVSGQSGSGFGVSGTSNSGVGVFGGGGSGTGDVPGTGSNYGVYGSSISGSGVYGTSSSVSGIAGAFNVTANGKILSGQNNGTEVFAVGNNGAISIGGGTAILKHLSSTFSATFPALKPGTCSTLTFTLTGTSDGDTVALGVPNGMMTAAGTPVYSAWGSATNTITIRACNLDPSTNQKIGTAGNIRVDVWKH